MIPMTKVPNVSLQKDVITPYARPLSHTTKELFSKQKLPSSPSYTTQCLSPRPTLYTRFQRLFVKRSPAPIHSQLLYYADDEQHTPTLPALSLPTPPRLRHAKRKHTFLCLAIVFFNVVKSLPPSPVQQRHI